MRTVEFDLISTLLVSKGQRARAPPGSTLVLAGLPKGTA